MSFSEIATAGDLAWMGVSVIAATTAIAFGVLLAAFRRSTWAYVAAASTVMLLIAPVVTWMSAQSSAERFGGGTTMAWMMVFPAARIYALLAGALATTNVALFLKR